MLKALDVDPKLYTKITGGLSDGKGLNYFKVARKHKALPQLCSIADFMHRELKAIWSDTRTLQYYPAFEL